MDVVDEIRADREAGALRLEREYKSQLLAYASQEAPGIDGVRKAVA